MFEEENPYHTCRHFSSINSLNDTFLFPKIAVQLFEFQLQTVITLSSFLSIDSDIIEDAFLIARVILAESTTPLHAKQ